jgi:hypothetical protein
MSAKWEGLGMQSMIEKIKKLLALSQSSNANEAAVAAAAAQRLMAQHQIAEAELGGEVEEKAAKEVDPLFEAKTLPGWLNMLSAGLCRQNSVFVWVHKRADGKSYVCICGRPSDVANVRFLFAYLRSEIERLVQVECRGKGRSIMDSYRKGAVVGAIEAMDAAREEVRAQATGAALLKVDGRLAEARAAAALGKTKPAARVGLADAGAYYAGKTAGGHLHGSAQLGAAGGRLLGAG